MNSLPPIIDPIHIVRHLYTTILLVDNDFKICWCSPQAEQLLSVSQRRITNQCIFQILLPLQSGINVRVKRSKLSLTKNNIRQHLNTSQQKQLDTLIKQFRHAQSYQQPFLEYNQRITGMVKPLLVDYSVTPFTHADKQFFIIELWEKDRQSRIDQDQRQKEELEVARQMLRSVAHEVKNPLAGIRGAAQLLVRQLKPKSSRPISNSDTSNLNKKRSKKASDAQLDRQYKAAEPQTLVRVDSEKINTYADIVISETDRLTNLIGQLLGSNQLPKWQKTNIHEPLEHVLMLAQARQPKVDIIRDYDLSIPNITADKDQLIQVFLNLVNNAYDAMLEQDMAEDYQPTLTITTRIGFQQSIGTTYHRQLLKVCVEDNGVGIEPEMLGRIFYPLVTGRASGTGLGLSLVQDIINRHQGMIQVDSSPGYTSFCIYLPFEQTQTN